MPLTLTRSGIGQDGYVRIQKETTFNTAATSSMTLIPALADSSFQLEDANIENANVMSTRLKQAPDLGRRSVKFTLKLNLSFPLIGTLFNLLLGTSTNSGTGAYVHTWLAPTSGLRIGKSFTMEVALGSDNAEQLTGCTFTTFGLSCDNSGQVIVTMEGVGCSYTTGVSRISSFSYPTVLPANFSNCAVNISGGSVPVYSFEYNFNLNYDTESFYAGSRNIAQPVFKGIPEMMLKCTVDSDDQFKVAARAHTAYTSNSISITSLEIANGTTVYKTEIEIPKMRLSPGLKNPFGNDKLTMDLEFDCGYGGTTTGSAVNAVMAEYRVTDATATYA